MAVLASGEDVTVLMELGFRVRQFVLDDPVYGLLDGDGRLDGTLDGIDVSDYVMNATMTRGRMDQLSGVSAGTASIELWNGDRRFDPINEASPFWDATKNRSGVVPRRKVTISCDGTPIFTGRITDVDVTYEPSRVGTTVENSIVTISAADDFVLLANAVIVNPITPTEELSGARVSAILDLAEVDYPVASRNIEAGTAVLGGGATYEIAANTNALTYLQAISTAEQGYLYVAADGTLTFTNRATVGFPDVIATFSDAGTGLSYRELSVIYGQEFLYNRVACTVIGGTEQVADDAASQTEFGIATLALSDLLLASDAGALALAEDLLRLYSEPQYRFDTMLVTYADKTSGQRATLNGIDISDMIEVTRTYRNGTPASVTKPYTIERIQHKITPNEHTVQYNLSQTIILSPLILDDPVFGLLDSFNALT